MPRRGRLYVPMDVNIVPDAREAGLTDTALVLYLAILADCKRRRTDGVISRSTLGQLGVNGYWKSLPLLIRSGWIVEEEGQRLRVKAWDQWHESEADIAARQKADRDRKRTQGRIPRNMWRVPG